MRKTVVAALILVFVVAVPATVLAVSGGYSSSLDLQASRWTTTTATTASTAFKPISGLSGLNVCAINQVTATLSMQLIGAPAGFQIRVDGGPLMQPGAIRFVPAGALDSSSFTYLVSVGPFENNDHHVFDVEWRSPFGKTTTLQKATLNLQYQHGTHSC